MKGREMSRDLQVGRTRRILQSYQTIRPYIEKLGRDHQSPTIFDVGCGEGVLARRIFEDAGCREIYLLDIDNTLGVPLWPGASYMLVDVCDPRFKDWFHHRMHAITCIAMLHEVKDPRTAVINMCGVLPRGGTLLLLDYSQEGWVGQETLSRETPEAAAHYHSDIENARRNNLDTDAGIASFWRKMFGQLPGQGVQVSSGDLYTVVYIAREWGELKQKPE